MFIIISVHVITCKLFMQKCVVIIPKFIKTNIASSTLLENININNTIMVEKGSLV